MPKLDPESMPRRTGSGYPPPHDKPVGGRARRQLGNAGGLEDFGVNLLELSPGAWSSQRHWHSAEDEFVWVLEGEVTLVDDTGKHILRAGDCAAFAKGDANGHHLVNHTATAAKVLEVGTRNPDADICRYPDVDLQVGPGRDAEYTHKDGTPYPSAR